MNNTIDPTYLRAIREGLLSGKLEKENEAELPEGIAELFEKELFPLNMAITEKQLLIHFFTSFAVAQKEVRPQFIAEILDWKEEKVSLYIYKYSKWFSGSGNNQFCLYHDRFRVYILQKITSKSFSKFNDKLIQISNQAISFSSTIENESYALECLSTHLYIKAMLEGNCLQLKQFAYDTIIWERQIKASKGFEWSKKMLNEMMLWASKFDEEEVIECALNKVDLYHLEQNDIPSIVQLVADGDIETALLRIEAFGGNDKEGFQRKFILYMLCLMELTLLGSKDKDHTKTSIEKILKHFDEQIPEDHSILNWNDFFFSAVIFRIIFEINKYKIDYKCITTRTSSFDISWFDSNCKSTVEELDFLLELTKDNFYWKFNKNSDFGNFSVFYLHVIGLISIKYCKLNEYDKSFYLLNLISNENENYYFPICLDISKILIKKNNFKKVLELINRINDEDYNYETKIELFNNLVYELVKTKKHFHRLINIFQIILEKSILDTNLYYSLNFIIHKNISGFYFNINESLSSINLNISIDYISKIEDQSLRNKSNFLLACEYFNQYNYSKSIEIIKNIKFIYESEWYVLFQLIKDSKTSNELIDYLSELLILNRHKFLYSYFLIKNLSQNINFSILSFLNKIDDDDVCPKDSVVKFCISELFKNNNAELAITIYKKLKDHSKNFIDFIDEFQINFELIKFQINNNEKINQKLIDDLISECNSFNSFGYYLNELVYNVNYISNYLFIQKDNNKLSDLIIKRIKTYQIKVFTEKTLDDYFFINAKKNLNIRNVEKYMSIFNTDIPLDVFNYFLEQNQFDLSKKIIDSNNLTNLNKEELYSDIILKEIEYLCLNKNFQLVNKIFQYENKNTIVLASLIISDYLFKNSFIDESMEYINSAIFHDEHQEFSINIAISYFNKGLIFEAECYVDEAIFNSDLISNNYDKCSYLIKCYNDLKIINGLDDKKEDIKKKILKYAYFIQNFEGRVETLLKISDILFDVDKLKDSTDIINNLLKEADQIENLKGKNKIISSIEILKTKHDKNTNIIFEKDSREMILQLTSNIKNKFSEKLFLKESFENLKIEDVDNEFIFKVFSLIFNDIEKMKIILYKYALNQLFILNLPQEKLNRYNRTLNLQWAIDIKNQLPN